MATCAIVASKIKISGFRKGQPTTEAKLKNLEKGAASRVLCFELDAWVGNDYGNTNVG